MFRFNQTLMDFVRKDLDMGLIPMLLGEPGIGKSSWLMALANLMHTKCFTLACNQLADKADLTGARLVPVEIEQPQPDGTVTKVTSYKQTFYPHAVIHDAIEYAKKNPRETPILFMDELNRTTPDVTSECLSIPTMRSIGSIELPSNLRVVIAGNDKGNVTSLDEASISRFVLYHVGPDVQTFLSLDPELNIFIKNVLTAHPEFIFCKTVPNVVTGGDDDDEQVSLEEILDDGEGMYQITTPRTLSATSRWLNNFTNEELLQAIQPGQVDGNETTALQEALIGHLGDTQFTRLLYAEITNNITMVNNQVNHVSVGKPQCYDEMKRCPDRTTLNDFVGKMTDNERSGCLLYAIYEKTDNTDYIEALAQQMSGFTPDDTRTLMSLFSSDQLDNQNIDALTNTKTPIGQIVASWRSFMG